MSANSRTLVLAYGNPGRRDDGLGPAFAAALEAEHLPGVTIDSDYQLTVEHAAALAEQDAVVFVDAACAGPAPLALRPLPPTPADKLDVAPTFSTHSVSPAGVLALAAALFGARPAAYQLAIRGYEFNEFGEGLSGRAAANLAAALEFMLPALRECGLSAAAGCNAAPAAVLDGRNETTTRQGDLR
jgi:hydrogenase maturation protease